MSTLRTRLEKSPVLTGAMILTLAGMISRVIGFFYRIFLSQQIGAEGMGIYQLVFPVYGICFSLCCGPVQTSISRYVAAEGALSGQESGLSSAAGHPASAHSATGYSSSCALSILHAGLLLSFSLACLSAAAVYIGSDWIAVHILSESRCGILLRLISWTIPICSLHCCISGYYYGIRKAMIPAMSQLAEQTVRVLSVYFLCSYLAGRGETPDTRTAMYGLIFGEAASLCFSGLYYLTHHPRPDRPRSGQAPSAGRTGAFGSAGQLHLSLSLLLSMALPLAANRLCVSLLQSAENILIPIRLQDYGITATQALSIYGVLTGMAYPFIMFPSAIVNSISVMLLPDMAAAQSAHDQERIDRSATRVTTCCLYLGILCTGLFLFYGADMGECLYNSSLAGSYITTLAWLCPFLYLSTTQGSILNGLGCTRQVFCHSITSLLSQLLFVLFLVPMIGIRGYLYGLLFGELLLTWLHGRTLRKSVTIRYQCLHHLIRPLGILGLAAFFCKKITAYVPDAVTDYPILLLCCSCALLTLLYCGLLFLTRKKL